ncbi:MAG: hypothetical protein FWH27_04895 [Planctomycetaceae bacterium]|nr:hypothetical protein [Planctomycetaceae bacterium]
MKCFLLTLVSVCFCLPAFAQEPASQPLDLGSKRELFVDNYLIDTLDNLSLKLHEPVFRDVSFKFDLPWEGLYCGYVTMIHDNGKYRAYYRGGPTKGGDGDTSEALCVAFSDDGIHWTKPKLGLAERDGSKENNIVMTGIPHLMHNFAPMIDDRPGVPVEERYKALSGTLHSGGLFAFSSPDGLVWKKMSEQPVLGKLDQYAYAYDSQNVPLWSPSEQCYVACFRVVISPFKRYIGRAASQDFLHWENIETMEVIHDGQPAPFEQFYTNQTGVYFRAPHIYVATPARFMEGRQVLTEEQAKEANVNPGYFKDCSDAIILTSRGGNRYDRTFMEPFVRPGIGIQNWVSRTNYPARNFVPTGENEMSLYVNANYATPDSELRRYSLRLDGFASLHAPYAGGTFVSKPLTFSGKRLSLNFSTSAAGGLKVQLEQIDGTPYPGFALDDCKEVIGNEIARDVLWTNGTDVSSLAGQTLRIRIVMKDADLYSLKFEEE